MNFVQQIVRQIPHSRLLIYLAAIFAAVFILVNDIQTFVRWEDERNLVLQNYYDLEAQFAQAYDQYRDVLAKYDDYKVKGVAVEQVDSDLVQAKLLLKDGDYAAALELLQSIEAKLDALLAEKTAVDQAAAATPAPSPTPPAPPPSSGASPAAPPSTSPPPPPAPVVSSRCGAKYYTQNVEGFSTYVIEADIGSGCVKVVTDTTTDGYDCTDNCPVTSLSSFVGGNSGFGGMNGTYLCPADYSYCAGEDGSFFWKVFNSNSRHMANDRNGLAHLDPFMAVGTDNRVHYFHTYREEFGGVCKSDTFCDVATFESKYGALQAGMGCGPALTRDGNNILDQGKLDDKQKSTKGNRGAVGVKGNTLFLVIAASATVPDLAHIMDNMDIDHSFNVDGGGSSAMVWEGSYKRGPGRSIPNAIVLVNK